MEHGTYASAGVDIDKGDRFVEFIRSMPSRAVSKEIGGFSGGFEIDTQKYRRPVVLSTTDGVGTKLLVAQRVGRFDTVGIDLVAMCVNDLIVCGAAPASFLDYIACGSIDETVLREIMKGIVAGCELADCPLTGGETAELPGMYRPGELDLAGFAVGVAEHDELLPKKESIVAGDVVLGLPSAGIHSNGLSLARKALADAAPSLWEELLRPTKIYVRDLRTLFETRAVLAAAHITGGGLEGNFARVIPPGLRAVFRYDWAVPDIFRAIRDAAGIDENEMRRVFNMGIGIAFVVHATERDSVLDHAARSGITAVEIGELVRG
ncbi:MAG TPA: phosphoribosylformylglycinamidine cyclo-ligase [Spirochaetia bacterium]|nr:phosphoribosylformylglycinamidine cyclo-ligase [Spirochaetia bacterium]